MKKYWVLIVLPFCIGACIALSDKETPHGQEQIRAEYYLMRTNLNMLKRENEVLSEEVLQYKQENAKQNEKLKKTENELNALQQQHSKALAEHKVQMETAEMEYNTLKENSDGIISELNGTNKALEERLARETKSLNQTISRLKIAFAAKKKDLIAKIATEKKTCAKQVAALEKQVAEKITFLESVQKQLAEANLQIGMCQQKAAEYHTRADKLQEFLDKQMEKIKIMDQNFQELKKNSQ